MSTGKNKVHWRELLQRFRSISSMPTVTRNSIPARRYLLTRSLLTMLLFFDVSAHFSFTFNLGKTLPHWSCGTFFDHMLLSYTMLIALFCMRNRLRGIIVPRGGTV